MIISEPSREMDPVPPGISVLKRVTVFVFMFARYSVVYLRYWVLRADVPLFPGSLICQNCTEKDPGNCCQSARSAREQIRFLDTMDTISGFSGKSYREIVQKKEPGNRGNGLHDARGCTGFFQIFVIRN